MKNKKNPPRISVITPSYNQGRFIKETIDSVLSQNYPNLEYWIIDGGSTDETVTLLKSYGKKIHWISEKDKGQANGINKGMKRATGEIVTYLNSDDVFLPNALNTIADFFFTHPEAQWVSGDYFIIDEVGNKIQSYVARYKTLLRESPTLSKLSIANYVIQPSTFWRRDLLKKIGLFDESLRYCMDYDYWMRVMQKYPLYTLDNHFSLFRIHTSSKGGVQYKNQFDEEHEVMKRYIKSPLLVFLHKLHALLIVGIYKIIK